MCQFFLYILRDYYLNNKKKKERKKERKGFISFTHYITGGKQRVWLKKERRENRESER